MTRPRSVERELEQLAGAIGRALREANVKDEYRPAIVGALFVALRQGAGATGSSVVGTTNQLVEQAFAAGGAPRLAQYLRLDDDNPRLEQGAQQARDLLEAHNQRVGGVGDDAVGPLYEALFRYTGGNTIGQYFTPRHLTAWMAEACQVRPGDSVIDVACGTGGFLLAAHAQGARTLRGYESEPVTAALCGVNMLLRDVAPDAVRCADGLTSEGFPPGDFTVALLNPPFPHRSSDTPPQAFVDRALEALTEGGRLAAVIPSSILSRRPCAAWRQRVLADNELVGVIELPSEAFQPYASVTTSIVILRRGRRLLPPPTVFVRAQHDGLRLSKGARVPSDKNDLPRAARAVLHRRTEPGFSAVAEVAGDVEWSAGAWIESAPSTGPALRADADELMRRMTSFYVRFAPQVARQRAQCADGTLQTVDYRDIVSARRLKNSADLPAAPGTLGARFQILYGMKALHSRTGIAAGSTLVISPTEAYNGCYDWLEFEPLIEGPFVSVAQTGSIGEAFVQLEPCAVNDDCLVLLPRDPRTPQAELVLAAATIRREQWRFSYGRKLTPSRLAGFPFAPADADLEAVAERLSSWVELCEAAVARCSSPADS